MSKLPKAHKFIDLSDYGRPAARVIANALKNTSFTPIHVTIGFIISGLLACYCILQGYHGLAAFFLILKSVLDAADGELARVKQKPSYTGRYLDSVADVTLNASNITIQRSKFRTSLNISAQYITINTSEINATGLGFQGNATGSGRGPGGPTAVSGG